MLCIICLNAMLTSIHVLVDLFVLLLFVPSTNMVISVRSVNLTTLFPGQAWTRDLPVFHGHTFTCNWQPFLYERPEGRRMTIYIISWSPQKYGTGPGSYSRPLFLWINIHAFQNSIGLFNQSEPKLITFLSNWKGYKKISNVSNTAN